MMITTNKSQKQNHIDYSILNMDANEITKNIFIGDKKCAANYGFLKQLGIQHIIIAGEELLPHFPTHFNYMHLKVRDSPKQNISEHFEAVSIFIGEALKRKQGVLVHCAFGVSRSATLVIAFLMHRLKISYQQAFSYVRRKRPVVRPNCGFQKQLRAWGERQ